MRFYSPENDDKAARRKAERRQNRFAKRKGGNTPLPLRILSRFQNTGRLPKRLSRCAKRSVGVTPLKKARNLSIPPPPTTPPQPHPEKILDTGVLCAVREICNKITVKNIYETSQAISDLFQLKGFSRAAVLAAMGHHVAAATVGSNVVLNAAAVAPYVALVRAIQVRQGRLAAADMLRRIVTAVVSAIKKEENDVNASNAGLLVAYLYLIYVVDHALPLSFLRWVGTETVVGATFSLTLLRHTASRLRREHPTELNAITSSLLSARQEGGVTAPLWDVVDDVLSGTRTKRKLEESSLHLPSLIDSLCQLIETPSSHKGSLRTQITKYNTFIKVTWSEIIGNDGSWATREIGVVEAQSTQAPSTRSAELNQITAAQHFTTEQRQLIFRVVISAADDTQCCADLLRHLRARHAIDVFAVVLQCCAQEGLYNSFYSNVLIHLYCSSTSKKQFSTVLQFALWDFFKTMRTEDAVDITLIVNLSCLFTALASAQVLTLVALRGIDLNKRHKSIDLFMRCTILRLMLDLEPNLLLQFFLDWNPVNDSRRSVTTTATTKLLKANLRTFLRQYFICEESCANWMPAMLEVLVAGTLLANSSDIVTDIKQRISAVYKALNTGCEESENKVALT